MTDITLEEAKPMCEAAIARAKELGITIAVSVVDSATNLIMMQKMDGTLILGIDGSRGKAVASVIFGQPSGELEERSKRSTFRALEIQWGGRFIMGRGAIPIIRNGEVIGACGVGGGTPEEDEECALSGLSVL
jgi:glc operon protein GlcG|tara:strand:- start:64 stop:462 length:399 start_codon:yes stop_codon:yes gene_type:complete